MQADGVGDLAGADRLGRTSATVAPPGGAASAALHHDGEVVDTGQAAARVPWRPERSPIGCNGPMRSLRTLAVLAATAVTAVTACSGDDDDRAAGSTEPSSVPATRDAATTPSGPATVTGATRRAWADAVADVEAASGTALFSVDLRTGAAEPMGAMGAEIGVLGVTVARRRRIARPDRRPRPHHVLRRRSAAGSDGVPVTGVEGSTLLALDSAVDGRCSPSATAGARHDRSGDRCGDADRRPVPVADPGIGFDVDAASGELVFTDALGTHQLIDERTAEVTPLPAMVYAEGDANEAATPRIVAVAVAGDSSRFAIDAGTASLVQLGADGVLRTIGSLGVSVTDGAAFDIAFDGLAVLTSPG